jgi:hypothetical protein
MLVDVSQPWQHAALRLPFEGLDTDARHLTTTHAQSVDALMIASECKVLQLWRRNKLDCSAMLRADAVRHHQRYLGLRLVYRLT